MWRCSPWHYAQCCALKSKLLTYFTSLTFVIYAVCYLHLLVHLETLSLTFCAGLLLLLLLLLGVRLLALPVHHRGVHNCSRVRDGGGVWRCGVRHLVGGLRFQWGTPKMSHLDEKCWLSAGERPGDREGGWEGGRLRARLQVQLRQITHCKAKQYRKLTNRDFKTNVFLSLAKCNANISISFM